MGSLFTSPNKPMPMVPKTKSSILINLNMTQKERSISAQGEKSFIMPGIEKNKGKIIGYEYRNDAACKKCEFKERYTKAKKGRSICRHTDQDFLDRIDSQTKRNMKKYKLRQMIVEHPFGTIKRGWGAYFFLTKRKVSVSTEISLSFLAYNFKRAINILGTEEILRRLRQRREAVAV